MNINVIIVMKMFNPPFKGHMKIDRLLIPRIQMKLMQGHKEDDLFKEPPHFHTSEE